MKIISFLLIGLIKFYKFFISPLFGQSCRFLPSCSEYFIESLKMYGPIKGSYLGLKRISKCHPVKFLGGSSGLDLVPKKQNLKKKYWMDFRNVIFAIALSFAVLFGWSVIFETPQIEEEKKSNT